MSVTSVYTFLSGLFSGLFVGVDTTKAADQPFSETISGNIVTIARPNSEKVIDLAPQIATNATVGLVASQLISAGASLTSGIRVQAVPWLLVPYFPQRPLAHKVFDMLVRVNFNFHIETPWYCSDADGTYSIYLFLFLDGQGHLKGNVDGVWFTYDGGGPFCTGAITSGLNASVPGVINQVKPILATAVGLAGNAKFKNVYLLPGNGTKVAGAFIQDADLDAALGLVPA